MVQWTAERPFSDNDVVPGQEGRFGSLVVRVGCWTNLYRFGPCGKLSWILRVQITTGLGVGGSSCTSKENTNGSHAVCVCVLYTIWSKHQYGRVRHSLQSRVHRGKSQATK